MAAAGKEVVGRSSTATVAGTGAAAGTGAGPASSVAHTFVPTALLEEQHAPSQRVEQICQFALRKDEDGLRAYLAAGHPVDEADGEGHAAIERLFLENQLEAANWLFRTAPKNINRYVRGAALCDRYDLIEPLIREDASLLNDAVFGAARGKHEILLRDLLAKKGASLNWAIQGAAIGGHEELVHTLLTRDQGASLNDAVFAAARGGHEDFVNNLLDEGASLAAAVQGAARGGRRDLTLRLLEQGPSKLLEVAVFDAAQGGHKVLTDILLRKGASLNAAIQGAARGGHDDLVHELIENRGSGVRSILRNYAVLSAAEGGRKALVNTLLCEDASLDWAVRGAARGGHEVLVSQLLLMGASQRSAISGAHKGHHAALQARLERPTYLEDACKQLNITTPTALLQFILEHPSPRWKTQLPRLLADKRLQTLRDEKEIGWFQQALKVALDHHFTPREAVAWHLYGPALWTLYTQVLSQQPRLAHMDPHSRGGYLETDSSRLWVLGTNNVLLNIGSSLTGLSTDELKNLFKKVNDQHILNAANAAARAAQDAFLREHSSAGPISRLRTWAWGIPDKIEKLLTGVASQEDLLARLTNAIPTASGSYRLCLERMQSAVVALTVGGAAAGAARDEATAAGSMGIAAPYFVTGTTHGRLLERLRSTTEASRTTGEATDDVKEEATAARRAVSVATPPSARTAADEARVPSLASDDLRTPLLASSATGGGAPERKSEATIRAARR